MNLSLHRRKLLLSALLGAGGVGLRSLATGLPLSFLLGREPSANAEPMCQGSPQFLIMSTSSDGDPITCNLPGTYVDGVAHSQHPDMVKTALSVGGKSFDAAKPWTQIPQWALDRACFFHHATLTVDHSDEPKVMRLMGNTLNSEMMISIFAAQLATCLQTIQTEPISLGARSGGELLNFNGRTLAGLTPTSLKAVLAPPSGPLAQLVKLRDKELDAFNAQLKNGANTAQKALLDQFASSQQQVRAISEDLIQRLSSLTDDSLQSQLQAATILVQMKVAPVITVHASFGGDNHDDTANDGEVFANERQLHVESLTAIGQFLTDLQSANLQDQVSFGSFNVFGRSLKQFDKGRSHSFTHNCAVLIGQGVKAGVIGGIEPTPDGSDFKATDIDSQSGRGAPGGDVGYTDTLTSMAKTFGVTLGVPRDALDKNILSGKVVEAGVAT